MKAILHPSIFESDGDALGICFGHQIIARALGGQCVPNNGRWEVGTTEIELTEIGKEVFEEDGPSIVRGHRLSPI